MNNKFVFSVLALSMLFSACQSYYFQEEQKIENGVWAYQSPLSFNFTIDDTTQLYNLFLEVKHSTEFQAQNAYSKLWVKFPDGQEREQQVSFELADARGEWLGKCSGSSCLCRLSFMPNAVFDQIGAYQLRFVQYTRQDSLEGIESLKLIIEKTKEERGVEE